MAIKKTWMALGVVATLGAVGTVEAGTLPNGISPNGIMPNGVTPNGISVNSLSPNGLSPQGLTPNGLSPNGMRSLAVVMPNGVPLVSGLDFTTISHRRLGK